MNKEQTISLLREGVAEVIFNKVNGEERIMNWRKETCRGESSCV